MIFVNKGDRFLTIQNCYFLFFCRSSGGGGGGGGGRCIPFLPTRALPLTDKGHKTYFKLQNSLL